jgi:propanol-preferring alcohol dehydrogenase
MSALMQAAVCRAFGQPLVIEERPIFMPGPGQVLIRVVASGVCHTDLHAVDGDWPVKPKLPLVPGHEGAGYVAAVGAGVRHVHEGDRVGVPWLHATCGHCEYCLTGREALCQHQLNTGYSVDGAFAEYLLADAAFVAQLPDDLDFATAAPILCAGVTTYKGIREADLRPGQWLVVDGVGGLGHLAVQYARAMGLHVVAVDVNPAHLALARELGAELTVNPATEHDVGEVVRRALGGGAHGALVTAVAPSAFTQSVSMLRPGGTCVLVGLPPGSFPLPIFDVVLKRLTIRGSIVGTRFDLREALAIAGEGRICASVERQPLTAINDVLDRLRKGQVLGRVVLDVMPQSPVTPVVEEEAAMAV